MFRKLSAISSSEASGEKAEGGQSPLKYVPHGPCKLIATRKPRTMSFAKDIRDRVILIVGDNLAGWAPCLPAASAKTRLDQS